VEPLWKGGPKRVMAPYTKSMTHSELRSQVTPDPGKPA
jgi:hypothetical protein